MLSEQRPLALAQQDSKTPAPDARITCFMASCFIALWCSSMVSPPRSHGIVCEGIQGSAASSAGRIQGRAASSAGLGTCALRARGPASQLATFALWGPGPVLTPRGVGQARPHGARSHLWPHRARSQAALAMPHLVGSPFAPAWLTATSLAATQTGCQKSAGRGRGPRTLGGCRPNGTAQPHPGPCSTRAASDVLTVRWLPPGWWSNLVPTHFLEGEVGSNPARKRKTVLLHTPWAPQIP
jgi:hypothetical protein